MSFSTANITALVIAASFAAGLNIYATVLTLGILARTQWVALPPGLDSLGHTWVLVVCGILFAVEFFADKIPGFDVVWNGLHTVVRVPIAALVAYHASSQLSPQMQVMATMIGGLVALAAHSSKTGLRVLVTPSPEPVSNIALSAGEDVAAVGLTWLATRHPVVGAAIAGGLLVVALVAARVLWRALQRVWVGLRGRWQRSLG
ncbi:DUF4126 domain-containing protein [Granulicella arctica]|uniref:DUF4126 domain-containing protein n=1 Tax=Granulicella arctica TaxID=940613 RepID=A0A7Y9PFW9_9BACT|nr:DUF4126 domain-containing protein [Granulicella arctica]NYF78396.1 hypothetical protein [Granulicella arctica]